MIDALSMLSRFGCRFGMLLVLCCAAPAQAAWTFMGLQDGVGFFVDAENAESVNGYRRVWVQQNYPSPNVYRAQSMMLLIEIDCSNWWPIRVSHKPATRKPCAMAWEHGRPPSPAACSKAFNSPDAANP
jgi:hypothetical protein